MDFRCNSCHTLLVRTSTCYYTANCGHIYCEGCICQLFPQNWVSGGSNSGQQQYGVGRDHHESQDTEQQSLRSKFNINDPHFSFKSSEYHQIYDGGTKCVICHARIQPSDIKEILLGIQSPISIIDHMLQYIFQNTNWSSILENLLQLSSCTTDLSTFIYQQLLYEITYQQETSHKVIKKMEQTIEEKVEFDGYHYFFFHYRPMPIINTKMR